MPQIATGSKWDTKTSPKNRVDGKSQLKAKRKKKQLRTQKFPLFNQPQSSQPMKK